MSEPQIDEDLIVRMRDTMAHRGPDDAGVYITQDRRLAFGHRRLSIVDLSAAGHNPMPNEDHRIWITFNGEIYNHQDLRQTLIDRGHSYRSRTDTETIIHLYEERGLDFVADIEGDFAIALWDQNNQRLVLARDRIGVKPLYYRIAGGRLLFASEIKSLLEHPAVSREMDEQALYHYLTFMTTPAPQTLFAGIEKLAAGCLLVCNARGEVRIERYWDVLQPATNPTIDEQECVLEIRRLLSESIQKRMMSDVPFGVFLSGGIDSSANVALMAQVMDRPVRTFTVGFRNQPAYNELEEARFVAREYGTDHHEVIIDQDELLRFLPDLIFHQDEPIADPVCVPLYYVSKLARESGTTVVQVGEGSDELFCGYSHYTHYLNLHRYGWQYLVRLPASVRQSLATAGRFALALASWSLPSRVRKFGPDLLRRLGASEELFLTGALVFDESNKRNLLTDQAQKRIVSGANGAGLPSHSVVRADLERLLASKPDSDQMQKMTYQELKLRLPELLLMRVDKITMATSVEARVPFLDHKLVEFVAALPQGMKYRDGETKYILKRALKGIVPDQVLNRRKKGFSAPINEWMLGRLGVFVEETLLGSSMTRLQIFNYDFIRRLLTEQRSGSDNHSTFLWTLLNLNLWYERWIDSSRAGGLLCDQAAQTSKPRSSVTPVC